MGFPVCRFANIYHFCKGKKKKKKSGAFWLLLLRLLALKFCNVAMCHLRGRVGRGTRDSPARGLALQQLMAQPGSRKPPLCVFIYF